MKHLIYIITILCIITSCTTKFSCPLCGCNDTEFITDTIDRDIELPVLLEYGKPTKAGDYIITIYRDNTVLRHTQKTERVIEYCSCCNYAIDKYYYTIFNDYNSKIKYSTTKYFIEEIGTGKVIYDFGNKIAACYIIE